LKSSISVHTQYLPVAEARRFIVSAEWCGIAGDYLDGLNPNLATSPRGTGSEYQPSIERITATFLSLLRSRGAQVVVDDFASIMTSSRNWQG